MRRSLRWRLQAWYALTLLTAIGLFAGVLYGQAQAERMARIDARLTGAVAYLDAALRSFPRHELEGEAAPGPPDGPPRGPPKGPPDRPPPRPGERTRRPPPRGGREQAYAGLELPPAESGTVDLPQPYFCVWREDGTVVKASAEPSPPPPDASARPKFRLWGSDRQAYLLGPRRTVVLVGIPMAKEQAAWKALAWRLTGAGTAALAVGLLGGWVISGRLLRPIQKISQTAAAISASSLASRIDDRQLDAELVGLARVLNDMFARLEAAFERQTRFAADASHELRTPLAVVHANLELALSRPRTPEEYRATLQSCLAASGWMRAITDGLLTLAQADAGRLDPNFHPLDLRGVARDAVTRHADAAEQVDVALSTDLSDHPAVVRGDQVYLARVVDNLVANALRHTPAGGTVTVGVTTNDAEAVLTVADTGLGVAPEDKPRIFERFYRADASRSRASGGCGLGLAICEGLVKAHGGTIRVDDAPTGGARFTVRLPLERDPSGP